MTMGAPEIRQGHSIEWRARGAISEWNAPNLLPQSEGSPESSQFPSAVLKALLDNFLDWRLIKQLFSEKELVKRVY